MVDLNYSTSTAIHEGVTRGAKKAGETLGKFTTSVRTRLSNAFEGVGKDGSKAFKTMWSSVTGFIKNNPITSIILGGGIFSFITQALGDFKALSKETARMGATFGVAKGQIADMAMSLHANNADVDMQDILSTMSQIADEGVPFDKSMKEMANTMIGFKAISGEVADSLIPLMTSLKKTGTGTGEIGKMVGATIGEWGQKAPRAINAIAKYARATSTGAVQVSKGFNKIGGTLKMLGASSEEAQDFMETLYDQDYRKMPPMFQAFAHLRKDGAAFANAIKPAMGQMQNILRGVPEHLVPQMAESLGISTEIANAMRGGLDYEAATREQEKKKAVADMETLRAKTKSTIGYAIDEIFVQLQNKIFGKALKNEPTMIETIRHVGGMLNEVMEGLMKILGDPQVVKGISDTIIAISDAVGGIAKWAREGGGDVILNMFRAIADPKAIAGIIALKGLFALRKAGVGFGDVGALFGKLKKGKGAAGGAGDWLNDAQKAMGGAEEKASGSGGFFTKEKGEGIAAFFKPLTSALPGMASAALGIAAFGAALASTVYLMGEALGGERGKNLAAFIGSIADSIGRLLKTLLESKPVMTIFETLANIIEKLANAIFKIQDAAMGVGGKVLGAAMKLVGLDSSETPSTVTTQTATTTTPIVRSAETTAAMTKSLSFDASKQASDNQLLMDIRTILAASLDVERGQLGAIIDQRSIEKSKLLLQELDAMRGR